MKSRTLILLLAGLAAGVPAAEAAASRLYAAVSMTKAQKNSPTPLDSGLYVRGDDGQWTIFGPRILGVSSVAMSPVNPAMLLLPCADGVVRSMDGGRTWRKVTGWQVADVRGIVFDSANPAHLYAATAWGPIRSVNSGATWQVASEGLPAPYGQTIVADNARGGHVFVGTETGIYESRDGAKSWRRVSFPEVQVLRLAQSRLDPKLFLVGTQGRGAWLSRDGGATWKPTDPGTATANLYTVAFSPDDVGHLATGGWNVGVRVSPDGGRTWTDRSAGLPTKNVFIVIFDPNVKGRLWASTFEEGTFYSDDLGVTWHDGGLYGAYASDFVFLPPAH